MAAVVGTTLPKFKRAFCDALAQRPGLADVSVRYSFTETELTSAEFWFGDAKADADIPVLRHHSQSLKLDETYIVKATIQVLKNQGESQEVADLRATEILSEVQQELAANPQTCPEIHWATMTGWEYKYGVLKSGHGAGFDVSIRVRARLYPD